MASWVEAWEKTENAVLRFIGTILDGEENKTSFVGEFPTTFDYSRVPGMYYFGLEGGQAPIDFEFNMDTPGGGNEKEFRGTFHGVYNDRSVAMRTAGKLLDALPMTESAIDGVRRIRVLTQPRLERAVIERTVADERPKGGPMRVWSVQMELLVLFVKTEGPA